MAGGSSDRLWTLITVIATGSGAAWLTSMITGVFAAIKSRSDFRAVVAQLEKEEEKTRLQEARADREELRGERDAARKELEELHTRFGQYRRESEAEVERLKQQRKEKGFD